MVTIELAPNSEVRLKELAMRQGQSVDQLARQIVEDFLAFQNLSDESNDHWAESSLALAPEVFPAEPWDEGK